MTGKEWDEKYGAIRDRFMKHYNLDVYKGFTGMMKESCWVSGFTGEDACYPESGTIGLMLDDPIIVEDTFEGLKVYQWKTPQGNERPIRVYGRNLYQENK